MLSANAPGCQVFLHAYVPWHVTCKHAWVSSVLTSLGAMACYVPTCQRANVPACQRATVPTCLRGNLCYVSIYPRLVCANFLHDSSSQNHSCITADIQTWKYIEFEYKIFQISTSNKHFQTWTCRVRRGEWTNLGVFKNTSSWGKLSIVVWHHVFVSFYLAQMFFKHFPLCYKKASFGNHFS